MTQFTHGRQTSVLINGFDLSTFFKQASVARTVDVAETTHFHDSVKGFVTGMTDGKVSLTGMFSADVGGVDQVMSAVFGQASPFPFIIESMGPGLFNQCQIGQAEETQYQVQGSVSDIVGVTCDLQASLGVFSGTILHDLGSEAVVSDAHGTDHDRGADLSNSIAHGVEPYTLGGGMAVVQATVLPDLATLEVLIEHSPDNTTWATLITMPLLTGTTPNPQGSCWETVPQGTQVNRYVRVSWTVTGSAVTFAAAFAPIAYAQVEL